MLIVDSSVWIDYFSGRNNEPVELLEEALGKREIGLCDIILCEVLQGFRSQHDFEVGRAALLGFSIYPAVGVDLAIKSAENYRTLRRQGVTVRKTIDCLIATFVLEHNHQLLHKDTDFDPFETYLGLSVLR